MTTFIPTIKELSSLIRFLKKEIGDEYRADEFDTIPGMCLTIGADDTGWSYQTGDNSYSGGAYFYKTWAVVSIYRNSNSRDLAIDIRDQLREQGE